MKKIKPSEMDWDFPKPEKPTIEEIFAMTGFSMAILITLNASFSMLIGIMSMGIGYFIHKKFKKNKND